MDKLPSRKSNRLEDYNYATFGSYFLTICSFQRKPMFGYVKDSKMYLNDAGRIVEEEWLRSKEIRKELTFGEYCIMPNHFHCIVNLWKHDDYNLKDKEELGKPKGKNIPSLMRGFKSSVTRELRIFYKNPNMEVWQRGYHDHIIKHENVYNRISEYIRTNPKCWYNDKLFKR